MEKIIYLYILIGIFNIIIKKNNFIILLISLEIVLIAISLLYLIITIQYDDSLNILFSIFILIIGATESAIGLTILIVYYRNYTYKC